MLTGEQFIVFFETSHRQVKIVAKQSDNHSLSGLCQILYDETVFVEKHNEQVCSGVNMSASIDRRNFLKFMGTASAAGVAALAGSQISSVSAQQQDPTPTPAGMEGMDMGESTPEPGSYQEMDMHHGEGVQVFLDHVGQEEDFWRQEPLAYTMDGDVKVFELTCSEIDWETTPGQPFAAMAYNGRVPGPTIRFTVGDKVRVNVTNQMTQSTAVHWHGLLVPYTMDGVPFITQDPIAPGATFTYEFTARNAGTHMYHSHHNAAEQVSRGLMGALIVDPADTSREPVVDADYVMIMNDAGGGFTINGRGFPYTQPMVAQLGQKIRVRYMNEGFMIHPFHLHGLPQLVFAKDGYHLPTPYMCDTLNIAPGERYDVLVDCTEPGIWAYHCHILTHAESRHGMFGMVTVLIVQEPD
jgi:FtsP/CotA-like multicopper oxidase with cupredoxin domain